jgi:hypothetical protein
MKFYCSLIKLLLPFALVFSACACSTESAIQQVFEDSGQAPVFLDCRAVSSTEIAFTFSHPVKVSFLRFDPPLEFVSIEEGKTVTVKTAQPLEGGEKFTADILVEDENRNTLNVLTPFKTRNDRIPKILINELRTEAAAKSDARARVEFVELYTLSEGNLGALQLFIVGDNITKPVLEFPSIEVSRGEYIVVHLRTREDGCVDETGQDLSLSKGMDALPGARDIWIPDDKKRLNKHALVYLMDQDGAIIDGVAITDKPENDAWGKPAQEAAAALFGDQGVWRSGSGGTTPPSPNDAVNCGPIKTSVTKSISRKNFEDTNTAQDWYLTAQGKATPGEANQGEI